MWLPGKEFNSVVVIDLLAQFTETCEHENLMPGCCILARPMAGLVFCMLIFN